MWHPSYNQLGKSPSLPKFIINNRVINSSNPTYIIAELSCNHNQDKNTALKLIKAAHNSGADAIKLQTYTQDTMTIDCSNSYFTDCLKGTLWEGETLYQLYSRAYTPWEWTKELKDYANSLGMDLFSSPFDTTAVDFLEKLDIPVYKIALGMNYSPFKNLGINFETGYRGTFFAQTGITYKFNTKKN